MKINNWFIIDEYVSGRVYGHPTLMDGTLFRAKVQSLFSDGRIAFISTPSGDKYMLGEPDLYAPKDRTDLSKININ